MQRSLIIFLLSLILVLPALAAPNIAAESYILIDAETGTILSERDADLRLPPASLTKIMTVYVIFSAIQHGQLNLSQQIEISEKAWASNVVGSKMFIEVGSQVSVRDLLYGVIVQSGNDASIALAEALSADETAFAEQMNTMAKKMGLTNSHFSNATGLPAPDQYVSARDVATIVRRTVLDYPEWYPIYAEQAFTYNNIRQPNRNKLLTRFPGADGVKTGYTKEAGYCLASSAQREKQRLIAVVMKTDSPRARERESAKLLNYGFNNFKNVHLFTMADERILPLWRGEKPTITMRPATDGIFTVARQARLRTSFEPLSKQTIAPIEAGTVLGQIVVFADDEEIRKIDVVAAQAVAVGGLWQRLKDDIKLNLEQDHDNAMLSEW